MAPGLEAGLNSGSRKLVCQDARSIGSKGFWVSSNPLDFTTPLLLLQLSTISFASLLIDIGLRRLGQSTIVSQICGGMLFGPSALGHKGVLGSFLFPARGIMILETSASFGLMFFLFAVGVQSDANMMVRPRRKAMAIGTSVMVLTLFLTCTLAYVIKKYIPMDASLSLALPLIAASQCLTPFANVACLLTELKIVNSDLGRLAISSAMFCDVLGISLTSVAFAALQPSTKFQITPIWALVSTFALVLAIIYIFRPIAFWIVRRIPEGQPVGEFYIIVVFLFVLIVALAGETVGQHFVFGPLILGLAIPDGPPLGAALVSKLDYPVTKLLYPTFLCASGLKTNFSTIHLRSLFIVVVVVTFSSLVKILGVIVPAYYNGMRIQDAFVIGLMMNARGICELALYNLWRDAQVLTDQEFALVVISVVGVTAVITPVLKFIYDPSRRHSPIKRRTIQHAKRGEEFRIMVCVHKKEEVPSILKLLEASNATEESPIAIIVLILIEMVGRATSMLIAHRKQTSLELSKLRSGQIINALQQFKHMNKNCATIQSYSAYSLLDTMHEDVCSVALNQNANILIVPFHKRWAIDGTVDSVNRAMRSMNCKVLDKAPCSVGILVDRGILTGTQSIANSRSQHNVAMIYIGGHDDAEALCYSARMASHDNVSLTIIRFLPFGSYNTRERKLDNEIIDGIRRTYMQNEEYVYQEEVVRDGEGLAACLKALEDKFHLIIVGMHHQESPLLLGLDAWSECPELGLVGDMLASPDFRPTASVLIVQQKKVIGANSTLIKKIKKTVVADEDRLNNEEERCSPPFPI